MTHKPGKPPPGKGAANEDRFSVIQKFVLPAGAGAWNFTGVRTSFLPGRALTLRQMLDLFGGGTPDWPDAPT